jgi:carbon monoxide dehydrogenase subunit G
MKLEQAFVVRRPRHEVLRRLDDDETFAALFPDTRVIQRDERVRETCSPVRAFGQERQVRFIFETLPDGDVRFAKVCDGNVWRSLEGEVRLEEKDAETTRVSLRMEGRTRAFVPEFTIRAPMGEQIGQMARALHERLEGD